MVTLFIYKVTILYIYKIGGEIVKKINLIVDSHVKIKLKDLDDEVFDKIIKIFKYPNQEFYKQKARNHGRIPKNIEPYFVSYQIKKKEIWLNRGTIKRLKNVLKQHDYIITTINNTTKFMLPFELKLDTNSIFEKRDYQQRACRQMTAYKQGFVRAGCGSGKTNIILENIFVNKRKSLIICNTKRVMKQFLDAIYEKFDINEKYVGQWGDGIKQLRPITVSLIQSVINDIDKLKDKFGAVYLVEAHHSPADIFNKAINSFTAEIRIGVSATDKRQDNREKEMFDSLGETISDIPKQTLVDSGILFDAALYIISTDFEGFYTRRTYTKFINKMVKDRKRNKLILLVALKEAKKGHKCLLLSDRVNHCKELKDAFIKNKIKANVLLGGGKNAEEFDRAIKLFKKNKLSVAIGTNIAEEGLDIPILDRGFFTCPTAKNTRKVVQCSGRLERSCKGKRDARQYYFWDRYVDGFEDHPTIISKHFNDVFIKNKSGVFVQYKKGGKKLFVWSKEIRNFL
jgi:superfamily II DNA or RNA helicase